MVAGVAHVAAATGAASAAASAEPTAGATAGALADPPLGAPLLLLLHLHSFLCQTGSRLLYFSCGGAVAGQ